jgi:methylated-DNA-[protein]-cysteine S-methyltransferase
MKTTQLDSPWGPLVAVSDGTALTALYFPGQAHEPTPGAAWHESEVPLFATLHAELEAYVAGRSTTFSVPLAPRGTPFQQAVWRALLGIPSGHTTTYGAIDGIVGAPRAVRAVGAAIGRNPIAILVPCHRVIGRDGGLTGYAGGLDRKRALLALEAGQVGLGSHAAIAG